MDQIQLAINKTTVLATLQRIKTDEKYKEYDIPTPVSAIPKTYIFENNSINFDKIYINTEHTMNSYVTAGNVEDFEHYCMCPLHQLNNDDIIKILSQFMHIKNILKNVFIQK